MQNISINLSRETLEASEPEGGPKSRKYTGFRNLFTQQKINNTQLSGTWGENNRKGKPRNITKIQLKNNSQPLLAGKNIRNIKRPHSKRPGIIRSEKKQKITATMVKTRQRQNHAQGKRKRRGKQKLSQQSWKLESGTSQWKQKSLEGKKKT